VEAFCRTKSPVQVVQLEYADVNDDCLKSLARFQTLRELNLGGTRCTGVGLDSAAFSNLEVICLQNTDATDETAAVLAQHSKLRVIDLSNTKITDLGLELLAALPQLEELYVDSTQLTNAALNSLARMPALRIVSMTYTKVSPTEAKQRLNQPGLQIQTGRG
jgi:Leucine-rich repeat (LRR) protein